ncbi:MAG: M2 family metallopeptidase [Deltaproteobacteria bacterium]|nr:M2 family metallopeptidase [Deltaproteobacteria bacterium]
MFALGALALSINACGGAVWQPPACPSCPAVVPPSDAASHPGGARGAARGPATADEATRFIERTEKELLALQINDDRASWVASNFVTEDTQEIAARASEERLMFLSRAIAEAARFDGVSLDPATERKLGLLKRSATVPAPRDPQKATELAKLASELGAAYATGKYCPRKDGALRRELGKQRSNAKALECDPAKPNAAGVTLTVLGGYMGEGRNEEALREAWTGWHSVAPAMRANYERLVAIGNEGAREIGFDDLGALWRSGYDMPADAFRAEASRLYRSVEPLYQELHCFARKRLRKVYGEELVPTKGPIPAHLLGNMWSQTWSNVYDKLEPYPREGAVDVTRALARKRVDELQMARTAEGFFTSLGLDPLPATFWKRSLFLRPQDREVECHASAWDVHYNDDLRIKMCIQRNDEDFYTLHHELGHNYYFHYYYKLPFLFQAGANDGFHEAIGDTIALSVTPDYLKKIGLVDRIQKSSKADLNYLMKMALDKIAFLPFGKLIDEWRWDVFAGKTRPSEYNAAWWALRTKYQGITPPVPRSEADFDPGAKYHVPGNVPYTRYFLAFIYQFQFYRALCREAGHTGPLHTCSFHGNTAAGDKLKAMLSLGASKPWQDALFALSGERAADAGALMEYFAPLRAWIQDEIKDETCGW